MESRVDLVRQLLDGELDPGVVKKLAEVDLEILRAELSQHLPADAVEALIQRARALIEAATR